MLRHHAQQSPRPISQRSAAPTPGFFGPGGGPSPFSMSLQRGMERRGRRGDACEASPGGRLTDARRAPRRSPVTRVRRFGARWSTNGGPCASPALHRGTRCRRPHLAPLQAPRSTVSFDEPGAKKISPVLRAGISYFAWPNVRFRIVIFRRLTPSTASSPGLTRRSMRLLYEHSRKIFGTAPHHGCPRQARA